VVLLRRSTIVLLALLCVGVPVRSQEVSAPAVKAAFVANFAKFVQWPETTLPPGAQLRFCVMGDSQIADELGRLLHSRRHAAANIVLASLPVDLRDPSELRLCHVLYVSNLEGKHLEPAIDMVKDAPVFTVSDLHDFATRMGGIAELYTQGDRMRFAINLDNAQRSRLRLDAPMLSLAKIVRRAGQ
jgi:hypothetical protein